MTATSLRALLQQAVDRRQAAGQDASFRALQVAVESEEAVRPRGLSLNRTTASQILRGTYKGDASAGTIRAVGWLAGVKDEVAFAAAGRPIPGPPFAEELPPGVDDLSPKERRAAIEILRTLVAQRQEINSYVDSSSGTTSARAPSKTDEDQKNKVIPLNRRNQGRDFNEDPIVEESTAAYDREADQGESEGERIRRVHDEQTEGGDPDGPEGGA